MLQSDLIPHFSAYINGQWQNSDTGERMTVLNPATGERLAEVPVLPPAQVRRAIDAAQRALVRVPEVSVRRQWLENIHQALLAREDEFARIVCLENGKPLPEARAELRYAASFFAYFAKIMEKALAPETLAEKDRACSWTIYRRSVGVVAMITPWNFPLAMIAKKIAPALAAGCPSIIKPAPETPLSMIALVQAMSGQPQMPAGMINLVMGDAVQIGAVLMASSRVNMLSFTGSTAVGRELIVQSAATVKRLGLELGGNAPFIVLDDADLDAAADALIANKFRVGGQTCVCANRIYVQASVYDAFAQKVVQRVQRLKVGNGMEEGVDMGPLINARAFAKVRAHLADALDKGARLLAGKPPAEQNVSQGLFFDPCVLADARDDMLCAQEETFGPLVPLLSFATDDEVLRRANAIDTGLAAYVFGRSAERAHALIARLHYGHCAWNTGTGPAAIAPFGGMLSSGLGKEGGLAGLLEYVELQTVPSPLVG